MRERCQPGDSILNTFAYTGAFSVSAALAGALTTTLDLSQPYLDWARENFRLNNLDPEAQHFCKGDTFHWLRRFAKQGRTFNGIILDPPKFGRGPKNETWRIEDGLAPLIADCRRLLDANSRFLFLTVYAVRMSSLSLAALLDEAFADAPGVVEHGDLGVREEGDGRVLPTAIFARWRNPA